MSETMCIAQVDTFLFKMAKFIAQIIIVGAQVVGRAFTQALRQEFQSGAAAQRASKGAQEGAKRAAANSVSGLNLQDVPQSSKGELRRLLSKLVARTFRPTMSQREAIDSSEQFIILASAITLLAYNFHQMLYM